MSKRVSKSTVSSTSTPVLSWGNDIVRNRPVAVFKYKGTHSKPVRRTVILTEINRNTISGYEVREGRETRLLNDSKFKTYRRESVSGMTRYALPESL